MPEKKDCMNVGVIGGGIAGLTAALSLRKFGHEVTIYERYHYAGEVGASLSCASNGGRLLKELGVPLLDTKPVILKKLIKRNFQDGETTGVYDLGDYEKSFGVPYYNLHRVDIHDLLLKCALSEEMEGIPCKLLVDHKALSVDAENGKVKFENGYEAAHDLIVAADGIRSLTREQIGNEPNFTPSTSCCFRCLFDTKEVLARGLTDYSKNEAIEYWWRGTPGLSGIDKIVMSPCKNGEVVSCYCFYPSSKNDLRMGGWNDEASTEELCGTFPDLDPKVLDLFKIAYDIKQWRLYVHQPYEHWQKGKVVLLGDAIHPMMPDQSLGAVTAIEDAFAIGYIFSKEFNFSVEDGLRLYQEVRKPRATRIQAASLRARENLNERIGWSSKENDNPDKLTITEICGYDIKEDIKNTAMKLGIL
ncbi:hypothetical protein OGAPHI_000557 [Ogataea philodendri]|uniref:FAD-binding domain-containing protein n=1 Tax=Ogataea philodendri TaxID=1378263 RepID=A0A9P8PH69_9ASCO|nr:uncharacterized protein OGAPHI_000557 [Ogataea philodendri]KAH3671334.1 hypothetical protein OGAPHI_000557 [Ogataea philodendri]